jgi:CheY-like chemotaxis protein
MRRSEVRLLSPAPLIQRAILRSKASMSKTILVVDDDQSLRELLRLHLSSAGYDVITAADGIEAGYAVLRSHPDLIITDVQMPHMDGFQFIEALRSDKSVPPIPVVFLTSLDEFDRGKALGAVGYVTKPVRSDKLLAVVAEHLPGGSYPIG